MALQLRRKTHESIVYIDSDSAPRIMPSGEDFILEDIPVGTRVIYPNPPLKGLPNREAAIRYALNKRMDRLAQEFCGLQDCRDSCNVSIIENRLERRPTSSASCCRASLS